MMTMRTMKAALSLSFLVALAAAQNTDRFNYRKTNEVTRDFGPEDWRQVQCDDLDQCVSSLKRAILHTYTSALKTS